MDKHTEEVRPNSGTINFGDNIEVINHNIIQILSLRTLEEMIEDGYLFDEYKLPELDEEISVEYETFGTYERCSISASSSGPWRELVDSDFDDEEFAYGNSHALEIEENKGLTVMNSQINVTYKEEGIMCIVVVDDYCEDIEEANFIDKEGRILCNEAFDNNALYSLETKQWVVCRNNDAKTLIGIRELFLDPVTTDGAARSIMKRMITDKIVLEAVDPPSGITIQQLEKYAPGIGEFLEA